MPRYRVIEHRALTAGYLIDAENEKDAERLNGTIITEGETDTWGLETLEVTEVPADTDELGNL